MWDLIVSVPDHCLPFCFPSCEFQDKFTHYTRFVKRLLGKILEKICMLFVSLGIKSIVWIFLLCHCYVICVTKIGNMVL